MTDATPLTFTDNPMNPLEELLYTGLADASRMWVFERIMLESDLYAVPEADGPGGTPGDDGSKVLRPGENLILRGVTLNDGRDTVTVFTDPRRAVEMFGEDTRILAMKGRNLLGMFKDVVVLLNPAGGKGLIMEPDQILAILEHAPVDVSSRRPSGSVDLADDVPEADQPVFLIARLKEALRTLPVDAAWLTRARWNEARQMGWFIDVRTDAPADEVTALCERAVRGLAFEGEVFDVSVSKPGGETGVGVKLV